MVQSVRWSALLTVATAIAPVDCATALAVSSESASGWFVAQGEHFESYSQSGHERAKFNLERFEELRTFFSASRIIDIAS